MARGAGVKWKGKSLSAYRRSNEVDARHVLLVHQDGQQWSASTVISPRNGTWIVVLTKAVAPTFTACAAWTASYVT